MHQRAIRCLALGILLVGATTAAARPSPGRWEAKAAFGPVAFVEGSGTASGLTLSLPMARKWDFQPEVAYLHASPRESGVVVSAGFVRRYRLESARFRPYLMASLGVAVGAQNWSGDTVVTPTLRCGAQVFLGRGLFLAPEARIGYVPATGFNLGLGYSR